METVARLSLTPREDETQKPTGEPLGERVRVRAWEHSGGERGDADGRLRPRGKRGCRDRSAPDSPGAGAGRRASSLRG